MTLLTTAYDSHGRSGHAYVVGERGDKARLFRAANRHSRIVRILRIAIPAAVGLTVLLITVGIYFNPLRALGKLPIDLDGLVISGSKITMQAPRLAGYTRDSRAYEVTARAAAQDLATPQVMELHDLQARVEMQDHNVMRMQAKSGTYDTKTEMLLLSPSIVLSSSSGYEGYLTEARIDIRKGNVVSDKPVVVKMLNGTLNANRLEVVNAGEMVRFDGGVDMVLDLSKSRNDAGTTGPAGTAPAAATEKAAVQ